MTKGKTHNKRSRAGRLLLIILAVLLGFALFSLNAEHLAGNLLPMPFGWGVAVVLSDSMKPALVSGDVILVQSAEDFAVGDVAVYPSGHSLVVHRIVFAEGDTVTTQGDANAAADAPLPRSELLGIVKGRIPLLGYAVQAIKTPAGALLLLAAAVLLLESSFRAEKKQQQQEIDRLKSEIRSLQSEIETMNDMDDDFPNWL